MRGHFQRIAGLGLVGLAFYCSTQRGDAAAPVVSKLAWSNNVAVATCQVDAGLGYQLQYSPQLVAPAWTNVGSVVTAVSNQLDLLDAGATNGQGFYRVAQELLPQGTPIFFV